MKNSRGFTLIELMIVVAVIGVLAAIAIPAYQDYLARAQMAEGVELLAGAKTPMAEHYANNGRWPAAAASVMGMTSGKFVSGITITNPGGINSAQQVIATMRAAGSSINSAIAGKTVFIETSDGGITWACKAGTIAGRYLPGACR